jgi:hypothetical protein
MPEPRHATVSKVLPTYSIRHTIDPILENGRRQHKLSESHEWIKLVSYVEPSEWNGEVLAKSRESLHVRLFILLLWLLS